MFQGIESLKGGEIIRDRGLMNALLVIFALILVLMFISAPPDITTHNDNSNRQSQRLPIAVSIGVGDASISQGISSTSSICSECGAVME